MSDLAVSAEVVEIAGLVLNRLSDKRTIDQRAKSSVDKMARELLRLQAALPAVVRDAERYRWLRDKNRGYVRCYDNKLSIQIRWAALIDWEPQKFDVTTESYDAAIDAARVK